MLNDLISAGKDLLSQEEAAPVKAQIIIKKGGQFKESDDMMGNMLSSLGLSSEDMGDLLSQQDDLMAAAGVDNENFTGYKDNEVIKVQMNPNSYTIKSKSNFKSESMGGLKPDNATFGTFIPAPPRTLSVKLFYDTMLLGDYLDKIKDAGKGAVSALSSATDFMSAGMGLMKVYQKFNGKEDLQKLYLEKLLCLTRVLQGINTPPLVCFNYGSVDFEGYVRDVSIEYKRFNKVGEVIRAEVTLSIEESNSYSDKEASSAQGEAKTPSISSDSKALPNSPI